MGETAKNSGGVLLHEKHTGTPTDGESHRPYHNKTIRERAGEWRARSGASAYRITYNTLSVLVCVVLILTLLLTVFSLPPFGAADTPPQNEVPEKYIRDTVGDTGATNAVAGMILDYRAFDTFGESCVLFLAVCGVLVLLQNKGPRDPFDELLHEMEEPRHDIILKKISVLLVPVIMLFGFYVVLNGHLSPGGGFSGGAIIGSSLILYASSFGTRRARQFYSYRTFKITVFCCLLFYALAKGFVFFTGANHLPVSIPLGTPGTLFSGGLIPPLNLCVGLVVASSMYVIYVLFSKGEML